MSDEQPATPKKPRLIVRLAAILLMLLVSGLLAALLGEVMVRIVRPQQLIILRPDLWMPADSVGWLHRPDVSVPMNTGERDVTVHTDREGYRVGTPGRQEAPTRVLLLGDSFMEALQVEYEQSTAHLLETGLSPLLGRPVVVRNAGIDGYGPNQYRLRARTLMSRDTFALLVVTVFVGNDAVAEKMEYIPPRQPVHRSHLRFPRSLAPGEIIDAWLRPVNDALETRSHLFTLLKIQFGTLRMKMGLTAESVAPEYRKEQVGWPRWATTARIAAEIDSIAASHGTRTLFVLIPERFQVYPEAFQEYVKGFGIDPATVDLEQPSRELLRAFQAESVTVIDMLQPLRDSAATNPPLFGSIDRHLTPEGHRVLTSLILPRAAELMAAPARQPARPARRR